MLRKLLTEKEVAELLAIHVQTLRNWRHLGRGLPYCKIGTAVRYDIEIINREIEANTIHPRLSGGAA